MRLKDFALATVSLTGTLMIPVVAFFQPVARADTLTATESAYVQAYGGDVCAAFGCAPHDRRCRLGRQRRCEQRVYG